MSQVNSNYFSDILFNSLNEVEMIDISEKNFIFTPIGGSPLSIPEENSPASQVCDDYEYEIQSVEYICQDCFCCFSSAEQHRQHKLSAHADIKVSNDEEHELEAEDSNPTDRNEDPTRNLATENSHDGIRDNHHRRSKSPEKLTKRLKLVDAEHNEMTYHCEVCLRTTTLLRDFGSHMKKHLSDKLYICYHCGSPSRKKSSLDHLEFRHDPNFQIVKHDLESFINQLKCLVCEQSFPDRRSLIRHKITHKKEGNYNCNVCLYKTTVLREFDKHFVKHFNDKLYICYHCGRKFKKKLSLEKHLKFRHDPNFQIVKHDSESFINQLKCLVCKQSFPDRRSLIGHKITHRKGGIYNCNVCLYKATLLSNFDRHFVKHFNDKLYICYHCGRPFQKKLFLEKHLKVRHDPKFRFVINHETPSFTNEEFMCLFCGKKFTVSKSLNRHKATHKKEDDNYHCTICLYKTYRLQSFNRHMDNHFNDKLFTCYHCGKSVTKKMSLERHLNYYRNPNTQLIDHHIIKNNRNKMAAM